MNKKIGYVLGAAAAIGLATTEAQAATCWSPVEQAAAKVRTLQTRLMDATFKCQLIRADITPSYNGFIRTTRASLQGANSILRARMGERDYDRFVTFLANDASDQIIDEAHCAAAGAVADAASATAGNVQALVALADREGAEPELEGGGCPITFATVAASVSAAPIVD